MTDQADLNPDEDADAAAMAAAMGFSNFGAQNPNKRRKFNSRVDNAIVASSSNSTSSLPFHHGASAGSGSNATPLGARAVVNRDEISLADDDDDGDGDVQGNDEGKSAAQYAESSSPYHKPPPSMTSANLPTSNEVQSKIGAILGTPSAPSQSAPVSSTSFHRGGRGGGYGARGGFESSRGRGGHSRQDTTGKPWWEDYYDPAFNVNPWEKLEKESGLEPRGLWMSWEESKAAGTAMASVGTEHVST